MTGAPVRLVIAVCLAEVLGMTGMFTFPALLPQFVPAWRLTNTDAGWISGIVLGAYALGVPVLVTLTDRIDARLINISGAVLAAISLIGFALFAEGFWSALFFRALAGLALAATYMPGLRILVDRIEGAKQARVVAFYTAGFSLGSAASFYLAGVLNGALGWRWAFGISGLAAVLGALLVAVAVRPLKPEPAAENTAFFDFRPILRNREALGYILA
ncbi:MAG: MFS transporter, partial [Rhodospirillales bacterium]|nr:MFS transporter [Rhodospirillales bacterium]